MDLPLGSGAARLQVVSEQVKTKIIFLRVRGHFIKQNMPYFVFYIYEEKRCIFCLISWPLSLQKIYFDFYPYRDQLEACSFWTWRPASPKPRGLSKKILKPSKIHHKRMIFPFLTYPLSPKLKPILTVFGNVSKLLPLLMLLKVLVLWFLELI